MRESRFGPVAQRIVRVLSQRSAGVDGGLVSVSRHYYDEQTYNVMSRVLRPDSNCLDIGCHRGEILRDMLHFAPDGTHIGFEPIPSLYRELVASFDAMPLVSFVHCALSEADGVTTFQHVRTNPGYSGMRRRQYDRDERVREIEVPMRMLDRVIPGDARVDFMKIDVEGAELQVLRGAVRTIARCRPTIVFEHGLGAADYYGTTPEMVFDLLVDECGLRIFVMADWLQSAVEKPLDRSGFVDQFMSQRNYYFMATP